MGIYFLHEESIGYGVGREPSRVVETVARRYCGEQPPRPFQFHAWSEDAFRQGEDGRSVLDFETAFPASEMGQWGYACGLLWSDSPASGEFSINCFGPLRVLVNGELVFKPDIVEEVNRRKQRTFSFPLQRGWNVLFVAARRAPQGFGCCLGSPDPKWQSYDVFAPFANRRGHAGWVHALGPTQDQYAAGTPSADQAEEETGLAWLPAVAWEPKDESRGPFDRVFAGASGYAYAWTGLPRPGGPIGTRWLVGHTVAPLTLLADGESPPTSLEGAFRVELPLDARSMLFGFKLPTGQGKFVAWLEDDGRRTELVAPVRVHGVDDGWLFLGPFAELPDVSPAMLRDPSVVHRDGDSVRSWRLDRPRMRLRAYLENSHFGRWNYPLGVTLYGLLQAGRLLKDGALLDYAHAHVAQCTGAHDYAVWDAQDAGYAVVNHQLVEMTMLDDCGSFGSAMLESRLDAADPASERLAQRIARHMRDDQERQPNGAFYRRCPGGFNEDTLWADDLYMSTPFMVRYALLSGDSSWLDDAARQFKLFRSYLLIPRLRLMSHVYDFKTNVATGVPWGRGNGWVLFSLSELLAVLPKDHADRGELVAQFDELAAGILAVQGDTGLWHQVLDEPASYPETSSTAMFTYALARSLRLGWLSPSLREAAWSAVSRGWEGLVFQSIDRRGNVYGVCRGSRFSFTKEYYRDELGWNLNDTHGIGIVLLAGIEVAQLEASSDFPSAS